MPKRRMTSARRCQIALWQSKSYTSPGNKRAKLTKLVAKGGLGSTPPGFGGRRSKQGGKHYVAKSGSNFKPSPEASAILAGSAGFRNSKVSAMESRAAMGTGPRVPKASWYKKKVTPSKMHGSGTGLSSAYRYTPTAIAKRKKGR